MYKDTEQAYQGFTLDVYECYGSWVVDFWHGRQDCVEKFSSRKKRDALSAARNRIDEILYEQSRQTS